MTEAPKHTPTPWRLSESDAAVILADDHSDESDYPYAVALCQPCVPLNGDEDYGQFNAARIVLAVNAYDDLVAVLARIAEGMETVFDEGEGRDVLVPMDGEDMSAIAYAALNKWAAS